MVVSVFILDVLLFYLLPRPIM